MVTEKVEVLEVLLVGGARNEEVVQVHKDRGEPLHHPVYQGLKSIARISHTEGHSGVFEQLEWSRFRNISGLVNGYVSGTLTPLRRQ